MLPVSYLYYNLLPVACLCKNLLRLIKFLFVYNKRILKNSIFPFIIIYAFCFTIKQAQLFLMISVYLKFCFVPERNHLEYAPNVPQKLNSKV